MSKAYIITAGILIILIGVIFALSNQLKRITADRDVQQKNVKTLFASVESYKVQDSLQAATIGDLQLTLKQYKQFRAEDASLINSLKLDIKRMQKVVTTSTESYYQHTAVLRDSVKMLSTKIPDSVKVPIIIRTADFADAWHSLNIVIEGDSLNYRLRTKESLIITNHVVPKKFLWFRFGCKEVRTDVVSRSPYTESINVESVTIR